MLDFVSYLLVVYLMTLSHVRILTSKGRKCEGCGRKRSCPNVRQNPYSGISVLGFKTTMKQSGRIPVLPDKI
jgi:hypothetical protein